MKLKILLFGIFVVSMVIITTRLTNKETETINQYIEDFDLVLKGVVVKRDSTEQDVGIIKLSLIEQSTFEYDPRDSLDYYLCIVKGRRAELIMLYFHQAQIGDTVLINGNEKQIVIRRNGKTNWSKPLNKIVTRDSPASFFTKRKLSL